VKFGQREIGEIGHYLLDKKQKCFIFLKKNNKILPDSPAVATARISPNICQSQPPTQSAPDFIQIDSLSVES